MSEEIKLKPKIVLRRKQAPAAFTFNGLLKVKCSWKLGVVSSDLDLCLFYKRKDGQTGGVFSKDYRQKKSDEGTLEQFPYMLHKGDVKATPDAPYAEEQINVANLDEIETAYICVLAYDAAVEGEEVSFEGCDGKVELMSDAGDYLEAPLDEAAIGHLCLICTIENNEGENSVRNISEIMDLATAVDKIPGFKLLIQ